MGFNSGFKGLRSIKYDTLRAVAPDRPCSQPIPLYNEHRLTPEGEVVLTTHPYLAIPLPPLCTYKVCYRAIFAFTFM